MPVQKAKSSEPYVGGDPILLNEPPAESDVSTSTINTFTHGQVINPASAEVGLTVQAAADASAVVIKNSSGVTTSSFDKDGYGFILERIFPVASGTPATVGTNVSHQFTMVRSGKLLKTFINDKTGPTGADLITDINRNGTSVWGTTQANRLKIIAGSTTGVQTSFDTTTFAEGDVVSVDVDQVGSTVAGQNIIVHVLFLVKNGAA
jgi:hypothetical protein